MNQHTGHERDLIALVADDHIRATLLNILKRHSSLGIHPVAVQGSDVAVHPRRDPGCLLGSDELLRPLQCQYAHALVLLDRKGCGREAESAADLENQLEANLARSGWRDRCAVVVINPELEVWVWSDSPHVERCLGWVGRQPNLRTWLEKRGLWVPGASKPSDPKRALREALREVGKPPSASVFAPLAESVSLSRCTDRAFCRLRAILQVWFPASTK